MFADDEVIFPEEMLMNSQIWPENRLDHSPVTNVRKTKKKTKLHPSKQNVGDGMNEMFI